MHDVLPTRHGLITHASSAQNKIELEDTTALGKKPTPTHQGRVLAPFSLVPNMEADVTGTSGQMDATIADSEKPEPVGLGLQHCPVYHPTEEEFRNPLEYIGRIRHEAEQYGICKIVPPKSWNPPFMVDKDNFSFDTRIQSVNELQNKISSTPEYKAWNSKWLEFLKASGKERKRNPTFCGREIDLFKFYRLVEKRGGYTACCDKKLWREVARLLGV